jgi:hypothetical protein
MIKLCEVNIDGKYYSFNQYTASKGLNILKRVAKVAGPAIITAMQEGRGFGLDLLRDAAQELVMGLDQEDLGQLCKDILADVKIDNKPISFDLHYGANYRELFKAVFEVLKGNFSDFLEQKDSQ